MAKRIVINVEPGQKTPVRRKSSRWLRILGLVAIVVAVVIGLAGVGAFFWWRQYQSTPAYSLTLLVDAAQRGDVQELARRIDDEEVARNMVEVVRTKTNARYGLSMSETRQQQIDNAMTPLMPRLKQTIHDEVAKEIKTFASPSESKSFIFLLVTVPSLVTITTEGDVAKAAGTVSNRTIELTMHRDADRWKLTGFNDDVVVQRIVDSVMKELPAIGAFDSGKSLSKNPLFKRSGRPRKKRR